MNIYTTTFAIYKFLLSKQIAKGGELVSYSLLTDEYETIKDNSNYTDNSIVSIRTDDELLIKILQHYNKISIGELTKNQIENHLTAL